MSHPGRRLSALIDGELGIAERDRVLAHLAGCQPCRQEAMALRALKRRMTGLGETTAGTDLVRRLLEMTPPAGRPQHGPAGGPWPVGGPRARVAWRRRAAIAVAASSVTVAGLAVAAFMAGGGNPQPAPTVTPAMDVFMLQHAITSGTAPGPAPSVRVSTATAP